MSEFRDNPGPEELQEFLRLVRNDKIHTDPASIAILDQIRAEWSERLALHGLSFDDHAVKIGAFLSVFSVTEMMLAALQEDGHFCGGEVMAWAEGTMAALFLGDER